MADPQFDPRLELLAAQAMSTFLRALKGPAPQLPRKAGRALGAIAKRLPKVVTDFRREQPGLTEAEMIAVIFRSVATALALAASAIDGLGDEQPPAERSEPPREA